MNVISSIFVIDKFIVYFYLAAVSEFIYFFAPCCVLAGLFIIICALYIMIAGLSFILYSRMD